MGVMLVETPLLRDTAVTKFAVKLQSARVVCQYFTEEDGERRISPCSRQQAAGSRKAIGVASVYSHQPHDTCIKHQSRR